MTYQEQLKHPLWQKKRLEVLEGWGFKCHECGSTEKQLHVHHPFYKKDAMLWEYEASDLKCLCADCHKELHELEGQIRLLISFMNFKEKRKLGNCILQILKEKINGQNQDY